jgi:hypothetical protein
VNFLDRNVHDFYCAVTTSTGSFSFADGVTSLIISYSSVSFVYFASSIVASRLPPLIDLPLFTMSSSRHPIRDPNHPPPGLEPKQQKNWKRKANKDLKQARYEHQYPPFHVPPSEYEIYHVHQYTPVEIINSLIDRTRQTNRFTVDTESDRYQTNSTFSTKLALIQVQAIFQSSSSIVIFFELHHFPPLTSPTFVPIHQLLDTIFQQGNRLSSWGELDRELSPIAFLFSCSIAHLQHNLQDHFKQWYNRRHPHTPDCLLAFGPDVDADVDPDVDANDTFDVVILNAPFLNIYNDYEECTCEHRPHKRPNETWSLQDAIARIFHQFLSKEFTLNTWGCGLDPSTFFSTSTRQRQLQQDLILYATYDCLAVHRLLQIIEQSPLPSPPRPTYSSENVEQSIDIPFIDITPSSPDQVSIPIDIVHRTSNTESNDIPPPDSNVQPRSKWERSTEAKTRRNRKRNLVHRSRRFQTKIVRPIYRRFTARMIRQILHTKSIHFTHIKIDTVAERDSFLTIGIKHRESRHRYNQQLPNNAFDRTAYRAYVR